MIRREKLIMAISKEEILDAIANMTVMEIADLIKAMEDKFGVQAAAAAVVQAGSAAAAAEEAEEQSEFTVVLKTSDPSKKLLAIKAVREITGVGLKDAKDMVEGSNVTVKENVPVEEAKKIKEQLEAVGCQIELK